MAEEPRPYTGPPIAPTEIHGASWGTQEQWDEMHIAHEIVKWRAQVEGRRYERVEVVEEYMRRMTGMASLHEENARLRAELAKARAPREPA